MTRWLSDLMYRLAKLDEWLGYTLGTLAVLNLAHSFIYESDKMEGAMYVSLMLMIIAICRWQIGRAHLNFIELSRLFLEQSNDYKLCLETLEKLAKRPPEH